MTETSLTAVQRAATERCRLDAADARRYLALVGALERVREDDPGGPLSAALVSFVALRAMRASRTAGPSAATSPLAAWSPGGPEERLVREGAAVAVRRFDLTRERAADLLGVPASELDVRQ